MQINEREMWAYSMIVENKKYYFSENAISGVYACVIFFRIYHTNPSSARVARLYCVAKTNIFRPVVKKTIGLVVCDYIVFVHLLRVFLDFTL